MFSKHISMQLIFIFCIDLYETQTVKTTSGSVEGITIQVLNRTIEQYLGIPYAVPPIGVLRFAKPEPIEKPIKGIIDGTKLKYSCRQRPRRTKAGSLRISEDCLFLNIWSPKCSSNSSMKPVLFWLHGGSFVAGSIFEPVYNGSVLATHDMVFVSANYRLGWFGWLYGGHESAPGNLGLYDQLLALNWVRNNIDLFGGDKNQITIFGQSAGSWSLSAHLLSPLSKGLFNRAIMTSGAHMFNKDRPIQTKEEALISAKKMAAKLNCTGEKWLDCLRKTKPERIPFTKVIFPVDGTEFLPMMASKAFEKNKFNKDLDLLSGIVEDEGGLIALIVASEIVLVKGKVKIQDFLAFVEKGEAVFHNLNRKKIMDYYLKDVNINNSTEIRLRIHEFVGDLVMKCPTYLFAKRYAQYSSPKTNVFFYELTHSAYLGRYGNDHGVHHASETELAFGHPLLFPGSASVENIQFSKEVMKLWTDFAKYGKPEKNWSRLVSKDKLSVFEFIRDLNPRHNGKLKMSNSTSLNYVCKNVWKDYF